MIFFRRVCVCVLAYGTHPGGGGRGGLLKYQQVPIYVVCTYIYTSFAPRLLSLARGHTTGVRDAGGGRKLHREGQRARHPVRPAPADEEERARDGHDGPARGRKVRRRRERVQGVGRSARRRRVGELVNMENGGGGVYGAIWGYMGLHGGYMGANTWLLLLFNCCLLFSFVRPMNTHPPPPSPPPRVFFLDGARGHRKAWYVHDLSNSVGSYVGKYAVLYCFVLYYIILYHIREQVLGSGRA